ncbi:putative protein [Sporisorium scitamineum]|uniref:Uncharacterized protein n=1 Tax=Sporisorium scitamineum TaxID=49012 RepID=A0A127Z8S7_9BASI|nr:putative protein [Sporisorium scitamineum]
MTEDVLAIDALTQRASAAVASEKLKEAEPKRAKTAAKPAITSPSTSPSTSRTAAEPTSTTQQAAKDSGKAASESARHSGARKAVQIQGHEQGREKDKDKDEDAGSLRLTSKNNPGSLPASRPTLTSRDISSGSDSNGDACVAIDDANDEDSYVDEESAAAAGGSEQEVEVDDEIAASEAGEEEEKEEEEEEEQSIVQDEPAAASTTAATAPAEVDEEAAVRYALRVGPALSRSTSMTVNWAAVGVQTDLAIAASWIIELLASFHDGCNASAEQREASTGASRFARLLRDRYTGRHSLAGEEPFRNPYTELCELWRQICEDDVVAEDEAFDDVANE